MGQRFGFVSTYPPTQCGLATFSASLNEALTGSGVDQGVVVRLLEGPLPRSTAAPGAELVAGDEAGMIESAERLNACDSVILQHEFGVFGGRDGEDVLQLLALLRVPTVVVLHTVLVEPSPHQRQVLEAVVAEADAVVTMTATASQRLAARYVVDMGKVSIIAHGAPVMTAPRPVPPSRPRDGAPLILTWGLLGPGKGIEWAIKAMGRLRDVRPSPRYVIAGQTHPKVLAHEGEAYRDRLARLITTLGLGTSVHLDPIYRDGPALAQLVASADIVLLPYDSLDQVTSGVLIEAVAAGKPVVATGFPHAVELLADGAGLVVPHQDPAAVAAALRTILTRRDVATAMAAKAASTSAQLQWPAVAARYRELIGRLVSERVLA